MANYGSRRNCREINTGLHKIVTSPSQSRTTLPLDKRQMNGAFSLGSACPL